MALRISDHCQERLRQRGIGMADLEAALARRYGTPQPGEPGSIWIRGYAAGGRLLKVCVRADDQEYVITAVWPDQ